MQKEYIKMEPKKRKFSIGKKMYFFVTLIVLIAIIGSCAFSFAINVKQIDKYFKRLSINTAKNFVSFTDAAYLKELRKAIESEEYQKLREEAEANEDEATIEEFLKKEGLWDKYVEQRELLRQHISNMQDIKYLYYIVWGDSSSEGDMYLIDSDDVPLYETGYYEPREKEFEGTDSQSVIEPVINKGNWGWLCSSYAPVYDENGNVICHVGCDIDMEEILRERRFSLTTMVITAVIFTAIVLVVAVLFVKKSVVQPLKIITSEMGKFSPSVGKNQEESGVINLDIKTGDEIGDIYEGIHSMQVRIVDYINDISVMQRDKEKAERYVMLKDQEIAQINMEAFKDPLTGVGNNASFTRKTEKLNEEIKNGTAEFAIVMVDANWLKQTNDRYGHSAGDAYIKGCCHIICEIFKHSPVFRIGGDEFVAILRDEDYAERERKVQELKQYYEERYNNTKLDPWLRFSASVGVAEYWKGDDDYKKAFRRADSDMYENKIKFKKNHKLFYT